MAEVSIREAAEILGVSIDTIRRRIRTGALAATKGPRAADPYVVDLDEDVAGGRRTAKDGPYTDEGTSATSRELIDALRRQVEAQERQIGDLHRLLDQAHRLLLNSSEGSGRA